jgi:LysM repeat protein
VDSDTCDRYQEEAVAFALGDVDAHFRAEIVAHLDTCVLCRREVSTLTAALDSLSAATRPVAPAEGFVDRVLAAAGPGLMRAPAGAPVAAPAVQPVIPSSVPAGAGAFELSGPDPARRRPVAVVLRRRRTLAVLTGLTTVFSLGGLAYHSWALLVPALVVAALEVTYLALVMSITRARARDELTTAMGRVADSGDPFWDGIAPVEADAVPDPDPGIAVPAAGDVVGVGNWALIRFGLSYFLGWVLTPVVGLIALMRGDLTGIEQSPVLARIVAAQRRGREQSIRLLVAGATSVAVAGGTATMIFSPGVASAAPVVKSVASRTYVVQDGDTLWGISERFGQSVSSLAEMNHIADPSFLLPGEVIRIGSAATTPATAPAAGSSSSASRTYTVAAGDTLDSIATRFSTTVAGIASLNHITDVNLIIVGQTLHLPGSSTAPSSGSASPAGAGGTRPSVATASTYTVHPGDTLAAIAARYSTTVDRLVALNHIADPNVIYVGQVLHLTGSASSAPSSGSGGGSHTTPTPAPSHSTGSGYVNPFRYGSWSPARTDEGVDWIPNTVSPVVAIGDGVITYSSMESGWPAGAFITYRLTSGPQAGLYIYVAEHLTNLLPVGTEVKAGQQIATALPGYPWTEWGWAASSGPEPAPGAQYGSSADGTATAGGKAFARFLETLGVTPLDNPGSGPLTP